MKRYIFSVLLVSSMIMKASSNHDERARARRLALQQKLAKQANPNTIEGQLTLGRIADRRRENLTAATELFEKLSNIPGKNVPHVLKHSKKEAVAALYAETTQNPKSMRQLGKLASLAPRTDESD